LRQSEPGCPGPECDKRKMSESSCQGCEYEKEYISYTSIVPYIQYAGHLLEKYELIEMGLSPSLTGFDSRFLPIIKREIILLRNERQKKHQKEG